MTGNAITNQQFDDGFDSYSDRVEGGGEHDRHDNIPSGDRLKFSNEGTWLTLGGDQTGQQRIATVVRRTEVRWGASGGGPLEVRQLGPGDEWRDLDAINAALPRSEWREGFDGKMEGPWQQQRVVEFVHLETMGQQWWATSTIGGKIAVTELTDRTKAMRRLRGIFVYPVVTLAAKPMRTKAGFRKRPHLQVDSWVRLGDGGIVEVDARPLPRVNPPSTGEVINDVNPY